MPDQSSVVGSGQAIQLAAVAPDGTIQILKSDAIANLLTNLAVKLGGEDTDGDRMKIVPQYDFAGNCSIAATKVAKEGTSVGCCIEILVADAGITASVYDDDQTAVPNSDNLIGIVSCEAAGVQKEFKHVFAVGVAVVLTAGADTARISVGVN